MGSIKGHSSRCEKASHQKCKCKCGSALHGIAYRTQEEKEKIISRFEKPDDVKEVTTNA